MDVSMTNRRVALVGLWVEVLDLLAAVLGVLAEVEVRAGVDTLHLLEAEGHVELDVGGSVGVVCQLVVVVEAVVLSAEAQSLVPGHTRLLPLREPLKLGAGLHEELHLHLLELAHTEDELACHNLIAEGLTNLCDTEGQLHAARLLHVQVVHEDTLCRLRTQVDGARALGSAAHLGLEHEVELTHVGPVAGTADGAYDLLVDDNLLQLVQVIGIHRLLETLVQGVALLLELDDATVGGAELSLVEGFAETLGSLGYLLVNLLVVLRHLILDEHIGAVALLGVAVVDEGVVEGVHVAAGLPCCGVHEDGSVDADDILVQQHH